MKLSRAMILVIVLLSACAAPATVAPASPMPTATPATSVPPTLAPTVVPPTVVPPTITTAPSTETTTATAAPTAQPLVNKPGLPLPADRGDYFSASGACASCHTNMTDASKVDVSIDSAWRASRHANAARDPYWQATVKSEGIENAALVAVIEDKCATCHMPMARSTSAAKTGGTGKVMGDGYMNPQNPLHTLAMDGISCSFCHQVTEAGFGKTESYSGGFVFDKAKRVTFGPFPADATAVTLMQGASGYTPVQSDHLGKSEFCGTCHNLNTPFVDDKSKVAGTFAEQAAYSEWLNSDFAKTKSCQDCHMPKADGAVAVSNMGNSQPRQPVLQHTFVGGNVYMQAMTEQYSEPLGITASTAQLEAQRLVAMDNLQKHTASLTLENVAVAGGKLTLQVVVKNQAGHKFPTGFPSRRAWLYLVVKDANRKVVFESGGYKPDGSIVGNDNDADPKKFEPHYAKITAADQVQIYEVIAADTQGTVTTTLLRAAKSIKDNRILPAGFSKDKATSGTAVQGDAAQDKDFGPGEDRVSYELDLGGATGPFTVTGALLYQSIGFRWADNLSKYDAAEIKPFQEYYKGVPNIPVVVASQSVTPK